MKGRAVELLAKGYSTREAALILGITESQVNAMIFDLRRKHAIEAWCSTQKAAQRILEGRSATWICSGCGDAYGTHSCGWNTLWREANPEDSRDRCTYCGCKDRPLTLAKNFGLYNIKGRVH